MIDQVRELNELRRRLAKLYGWYFAGVTSAIQEIEEIERTIVGFWVGHTVANSHD